MYNNIHNTVTCDKCRTSVPVQGETRDRAIMEVYQLEWIYSGVGTFFCPDCKANETGVEPPVYRPRKKKFYIHRPVICDACGLSRPVAARSNIMVIWEVQAFGWIYTESKLFYCPDCREKLDV